MTLPELVIATILWYTGAFTLATLLCIPFALLGFGFGLTIQGMAICGAFPFIVAGVSPIGIGVMWLIQEAFGY